MQLLGAVTQRREFGRSTRSERLREPGDDGTPGNTLRALSRGSSMKNAALPQKFEIGDLRTNFQRRGASK